MNISLSTPEVRELSQDSSQDSDSASQDRVDAHAVDIRAAVTELSPSSERIVHFSGLGMQGTPEDVINRIESMSDEDRDAAIAVLSAMHANRGMAIPLRNAAPADA